MFKETGKNIFLTQAHTLELLTDHSIVQLSDTRYMQESRRVLLIKAS